MQLHTIFNPYVTAALVSLAVFVASGQGSAAQDAAAVPPPNALPDVLPSSGSDPEGVETLTRGPVHEAFAAPSATDPKPGLVVAKKPPADIDEVPPDYRPEGAIWINGYWEWDAETEDFIWISGLWRVPPPEMRWVPPYWTEAEGGWQRVPGFWTSTAAGQLEYRPTPPDSLEVGPTSPAPADNYFYIPGAWSYYDTGYRWRSGYWSPYREDWVWCPARWIWTPAGCLYQAGYWDHRPFVRAQLYAPVRFTTPIYLTSGYRYRPWCVLDSSRFFVHLWIGPRSNCYYFGNHYGSYASRFGYSPWCNWNYRSRGCYDPLWSWCNTHYRRQGIDYIGRCRGWHNHYDRHEHDRPARTWNDQVRLVADAKLDPRKSQRVLASDLRDVVKRDDLPIKLTKLNDRDRESVRKISDDFRKLNGERLKVEREASLARGRNDGDRKDGDRGENRGRGSGVDLAGPNGDRKGGDKPGESKPDSAKVTKRLDELTKELNRGNSDANKTARLKLPEQSEAIREVTRGGRSVARSRDGGDDKNTAGTLPSDNKNDNNRLPKIDRGNTASRSSTGGEANRDSVAGDKPPKPDKPAGDVAGSSQDRTGAGHQDGNSVRGRSARSGAAALSGANGPDLNPPKIDLPATDRATTSRSAANGDSNRDRGGSGPKIDVPTRSSEGSKLESRANRSSDGAARSTQPRIDASKAPKIDSPKIDAIESRGNRGGENTIRNSQPRVTAPLSSSPRLEAPKPNAPRMEPRSGGGPSRIEAPRSAPRIESTPRATPRSSPRIETPRGNTAARSMPRSEGARSSSVSRPSGSRSNGGGGGNNARASGGNRDRGRSKN